jgi:hypothetical protein
MLGDLFDFLGSDVGLGETSNGFASLPPRREFAPSADQHGRAQSDPDRRLGLAQPAPASRPATGLARGRVFLAGVDRLLRLSPNGAQFAPLPHSRPWNLKFSA